MAHPEPGTSRADDPSEALAAQPTPDDGVRLSDTRMWDESTRPIRPAPTTAHRYTPGEQIAGRRLIEVHDHLRAELRRLRGTVAQVAAGTLGPGDARTRINAMSLVRHDWATIGAYCRSYCWLLTQHHRREDSDVFPQLREFEPDLEPVLDRLQQEHVTIHAVVESVDRALTGFASGSDGVRELTAAVDLLTDVLLSHLSYEERELTEPLARMWKDGVQLST